MLATPWIKDYVNATYGNEFGWHVAFAVCCVGLMVGLVNCFVMRQTMAPHRLGAGRAAARTWASCGMVLAVGVAAVFASAVILQYQGMARAFVYLAGVVVAGHFRPPDPQERARASAPA